MEECRIYRSPLNPIKREEDAKAGMSVQKAPLDTEEAEDEMTCSTVLNVKMLMKRDLETEKHMTVLRKTVYIQTKNI